jgi:holo-[acyl-carrier protein] synthase
MIYGIGTDLVRVSRMQKNIDDYGDKFAERILTPGELREYHIQARKAHYLARRFAAKEAAAKALGTGFSNGLMLKHIGVTHDTSGKPLLEFVAHAAELAAAYGIKTAHISLADEDYHAVAFVTLEIN